jgi:carboxyl-terminal processing protease
MNSRFKYTFASLSLVLVAMLLMGAVLGQSASPEEPYRHLAVFTEVLSRIKSDYVEEPDLKSVTLGAMNGLLESIDPFASYLNAEQFKEYSEKNGKQKGDAGLVLSKRFGYIGIVGVVPNSPAAKAGLSTGDVIETIQKVATRDMPLAYADLLLQGAPGSTVEMTVLRVRKPEPEPITLTRAVSALPALRSQLMEGQIGYIRPQTLEAGKAKQVAAAAASLQKQGAKKLILDLRSTALGSNDEGIQLANVFLPKGLVTYLQGQKMPRKDFEAAGQPAVPDVPLVVITNRGTANAAEIAAAALLDNKRAEVVGERTYGDAAVRRTIKMEDGGALILSVAKYYSPGGKSIQDNGVTPSIPIAETDALTTPDEVDESAPDTPQAPAAAPTGEDKLLKRAIEVLVQGKGSSPAADTQASRKVVGTAAGSYNG